MSRQSNQTAREKAEMRKVQAEKMEAMLDEPDGHDHCESCLTSKPPLNWGHIVSQGSRPDLRMDPRNMTRICQGQCHEWQETGHWYKLLNGDQMIEYIAEHQPSLLVTLQKFPEDG